LENGLTTSATDDLVSYKRMFAEARDLLAENRREQQIDDDYYHGYQLTRAERDVLQKRGQPDTVFNRYRRAINGTLGVLDDGATDPRAYGRNPGVDEDSADVVTKTLRFAADMNDFHELRLECAYDYLNPGVCAAVVEVDEDKRPKCTQVRWEEFFYDPRSRRRDFSDARYMGIARWMYADTVKGLYKDKATEIEDALSDSFSGSASETFEDRPKDALANWIDRTRRRLMVVEIYHNKGDGWYRCVFHAGGILDKGPSPYQNEKKKPDNAIVAMSCYVDRENNRMGIGRDMRSPQDEFNKRRQKLLHQLNNRQVQAKDPQVALAFDADSVRAEAAKPDGVIPPGWEPTSQSDLASGQFNLLQMAEAEMDRQGPNPAILGRQAQDASGRAQQIRQNAGMTEDAIVYNGLHNWEIRMYRAMWNRCKQFWTAPDYVRITEDEQAPQFIGINQPMMGPPQVVMGQDGMPTIQPMILGYKNALAELDVDIELDVAPDTATLAQEQFQTLTELAKMYGPQEVPFDDMLELSDMPNKRKLIEKRKARKEEAQQEQPPNPEMIKVQAQGQIERMRTQARMQTEQERTQAKMQTDQQSAATNAQLEWAKALLASRTQIETAEISANTTLTAAQISAAQSGSDKAA
jgi:hypothetical protein